MRLYDVDEQFVILVIKEPFEVWDKLWEGSVWFDVAPPPGSFLPGAPQSPFRNTPGLIGPLVECVVAYRSDDAPHLIKHQRLDAAD